MLFLADPALCEHNNAVRALNHAVSVLHSQQFAGLSVDYHFILTWIIQMNPEKRALVPSLAISGFASRYHRPELSEGFQDITEVRFKVC